MVYLLPGLLKGDRKLVMLIRYGIVSIHDHFPHVFMLIARGIVMLTLGFVSRYSTSYFGAGSSIWMLLLVPVFLTMLTVSHSDPQRQLMAASKKRGSDTLPSAIGVDDEHGKRRRRISSPTEPQPSLRSEVDALIGLVAISAPHPAPVGDILVATQSMDVVAAEMGDTADAAAAANEAKAMRDAARIWWAIEWARWFDSGGVIDWSQSVLVKECR